MSKNKNSNDKSLFDGQGRWVEERKRIEHGMRTAFKISPNFEQCIKNARVELPRILKDGSVGKKNSVFYRCAVCNDLFKIDHIRVDHIEPVCFVWKPGNRMSYDCTARRIFCDLSNLQVICQTPKKLLPKGKQSCHTAKSARENFLRTKWSEYSKSEGFPDGDINFELNDQNEVRALGHKMYISELNSKFSLEYDEIQEKKRLAEEAKEERKRQREFKKAKK